MKLNDLAQVVTDSVWLSLNQEPNELVIHAEKVQKLLYFLVFLHPFHVVHLGLQIFLSR